MDFNFVVFFIVGYITRVWRRKVMLAVSNPRLNCVRCSISFMDSIAAKNLLPLRGGDALRALGSSRRLGVSVPRVVATLLAERILDPLILMRAFAIGLGVVVVYLDTELPPVIVRLAATLSLAMLAGVVLLLVFPRAIVGLINRVCTMLLARNPVLSMLESLTVGRQLKLLFCSMLVWMTEGLVYYAIARSIPGMVSSNGCLAGHAGRQIVRAAAVDTGLCRHISLFRSERC